MEGDDEQRLLGAGAARGERERAGDRLHAHHEQDVVERAADVERVEEEPERREAQHPAGRLPCDDLAQVAPRHAQDRDAALEVLPERLDPPRDERDQDDERDREDGHGEDQQLRVRRPERDLECR